jgi:hypothetical protein
MTALRYLARLFIDTFGITHPTPDARDRAAQYIAFLFDHTVLAAMRFIAFAVYALHA